jgi:hypothetical protein
VASEDRNLLNYLTYVKDGGFVSLAACGLRGSQHGRNRASVRRRLR